MENVGMPYSCTSAAATSSWVESGLLAQSRRSAPASRRVIARLAVSVVTCRQAVMRMSCSGFSRVKRSRMSFRTGISRAAHSIRRTPSGARAALAMSHGIDTVVTKVLLGGEKDAFRTGRDFEFSIRLFRSIVKRYEAAIILPPPDSGTDAPDRGTDARRVTPRGARFDQLTDLAKAQPCVGGDGRGVVRVDGKDDVVAVFEQRFRD